MLEDTAFCLIVNGFGAEADTQHDKRQYTAVYSLIIAYLDNPVQDYLASAKQVSTVCCHSSISKAMVLMYNYLCYRTF